MLTSMLADWTQDMWGAIIGLFNFIPNWGWMIIVFTICLKLILSPLDFWQRKMGRDNAKKQAALQPELEKIQKRYGQNRQLLNQKTMELYKRENYRLGGSCVGMLVSLGITLFIFITLFSGLMGMSRTQILNQYETLEKTFDNYVTEKSIDTKSIWDTAYNDAKTELGENAKESEIYSKALEKFSANENIKLAQAEVEKIYETQAKQSFLWIKNIWSPDTSTSAFKNYDDFVKSCNFYDNSTAYKTDAKEKNDEQIKTLKQDYQNKYNFVTYNLQEKYSSTWNGYFILVILAGVVTYLSMWISQKQSTKKKSPQNQNLNSPMAQMGGGMKFMKYILPILMVVFTISYSSAFALYIIVNSMMSLIISLCCLKILEHLDSKKKPETGTGQIERQNKYRPAYSRENVVIETTADKIEDEEREVVSELPKQKQMNYRKDFISQKPKKKK